MKRKCLIYILSLILFTSVSSYLAGRRYIPATIQGKDNACTIFKYVPGQDGTWNVFGVKYYRIEPDTLSILRKSANLVYG